MGKSNAANWAGRWARGGRPDPLLGSVPDRANDPRRKAQQGDNPNWKCESCGGKGAMDYAGQGRVCKSCAEGLGF
jgi:hypothetical protein